jgi:multiple sugar transport system permease protein
MSEAALVRERARVQPAARNYGVGRRLRRAALYLALTVGAAATLFPFVWMVSTSLKPDLELFKTPPQLIPHELVVENYTRVSELMPIWRFAVNSVAVAVVATTLQLLTSAMAAYAFARLRFRGRDALFVLYLATLMVPFQVVVVPLFIEMRYLGLVDTYPGLILPAIASAFGTFLLRQAFLNVPRELEEAAFVDGAGHWRVFWTIGLPLIRPALAVFAVFAFMASWNSFLWPLVIVRRASLGGTSSPTATAPGSGRSPSTHAVMDARSLQTATRSS